MVPRMKRIAVCLLMVVSLMLAPVAHAAGFICPDTVCSVADQSSKKSDEGKVAGVGHHCCCHHFADRVPHKVSGTLSDTSTAFAATEQTHVVSITIGPLLEPPSRA